MKDLALGFYETPIRRLCMIRAIGCFVMGFGLLVFLFVTPEIDETGKRILWTFEGVCGFGIVFNLLRWWRTSPQALTTMIPDRAPVSVQQRYYYRMMWVGIVAFAALTCIVAWQLHQLETRQVPQVTMPEPVGWIYKSYGYWPAVGSVPAIGVLCFLAYRAKLKQLKNQKNRE